MEKTHSHKIAIFFIFVDLIGLIPSVFLFVSSPLAWGYMENQINYSIRGLVIIIWLFVIVITFPYLAYSLIGFSKYLRGTLPYRKSNSLWIVKILYNFLIAVPMMYGFLFSLNNYSDNYIFCLLFLLPLITIPLAMFGYLSEDNNKLEFER
jgi:hypothetical protein